MKNRQFSIGTLVIAGNAVPSAPTLVCSGSGCILFLRCRMPW